MTGSSGRPGGPGDASRRGAKKTPGGPGSPAEGAAPPGGPRRPPRQPPKQSSPQGPPQSEPQSRPPSVPHAEPQSEPQSELWAPPAEAPGRVFKLTVAYDGTDFLGWQSQARGPTLQRALEAALERLCGHPVTARASGRTDAGVHAEAQVVSFRTASPRTAAELVAGGNSMLPASMAITGAEEAPEGFDARRSARGKTYAYDFWTGAVRHPLLARQAWHVGPGLDWAAVRAALPHLEGERDFKCFQSAGTDVRTTVRTIFRAELSEPRDGLVRLSVSGSGFLRHMVRTMAGTLWQVGRRKLRPEAIRDVILSGDRARAGPVAPPQGLRLVRVWYDPIPEGPIPEGPIPEGPIPPIGDGPSPEGPGPERPLSQGPLSQGPLSQGPSSESPPPQGTGPDGPPRGAPPESPAERPPRARRSPGPKAPGGLDVLSASELFGGLGRDLLEDLAAIASPRSFAAGRRLFSQGDPASAFHLVATGMVKVVMEDPDGRERILHLIGPGSVVGEAAAFRGGEFPASAEALGDTSTLAFASGAFLGLLKDRPDLAPAVILALSKRLMHFRSLVESTRRTLPRRLAAILLELAGGGGPFTLPFSKGQLARRLDAAPESLSRALGRLKAAGAVSESRLGTLSIDRALLTAVAAGEIEP